MRLIAIIISILLLMSCSSSSNVEAADTTATDEMEMEEEALPTEPSWEEFSTRRENTIGTIWNEIKLNDENAYIVWVNYHTTTEDTLDKDPQDLRVCFLFDTTFVMNQIPVVVRYYRNADPDANESNDGWGYIVPTSEGYKIAQETKRILNKDYPFNREVKRKVSDRKNNPQNKSNLEE